jgi:hypothetical protein
LTRCFRTANSTPLASISRHLAPFEELGWKAITPKGLFLEFGPVLFGAYGKICSIAFVTSNTDVLEPCAALPLLKQFASPID